MPQILPVANAGTVRADIQAAAARVGIDFDYLLGQAQIESGLNPQARASSSSATGLFQFISSTWLETVRKHGGDHGLGWAAAQIEQSPRGPFVRDPAVRSSILALRYDPQASALMAAEYASDNRQALRAVTGREPNGTDLYMAHFLGPGAASKFLNSLETAPSASAALLFPKAAASNRAIFYTPGGGMRSVEEVYHRFDAKLAVTAGGTTIGEAPQFAAQTGQAFRRSSGLPAYQPQTHSGVTPRPSMAQTLQSSFGLAPGGNDGAPNIRHAYAQFAAFGL